MKHYSFPWNVPYSLDSNEPDCRIEFEYSPGNGKTPRGGNDPDYDPPVIEEVCMFIGDKEVYVDGELDAKALDEIMDACWDHVAEKEPQR